MTVDLECALERQKYDDLVSADGESFVQQSSAWAFHCAGVGGDEPVAFRQKEQGYEIGAMMYLVETPI